MPSDLLIINIIFVKGVRTINKYQAQITQHIVEGRTIIMCVLQHVSASLCSHHHVAMQVIQDEASSSKK